MNRQYIDLSITTRNPEILEIIDKIDFYIESQNYRLPGLIIWYLVEDYYKENPKMTIVPIYEEHHHEYNSFCGSDEIFATIQCSSLEEFREECDKYDKMFEKNLTGNKIDVHRYTIWYIKTEKRWSHIKI